MKEEKGPATTRPAVFRCAACGAEFQSKEKLEDHEKKTHKM